MHRDHSSHVHRQRISRQPFSLWQTLGLCTVGICTVSLLGMFVPVRARDLAVAQAEPVRQPSGHGLQQVSDQTSGKSDPLQDPDELELGEFELPLEYAPGEEEGRGWMCPGMQPAPRQRAMFIVRQEMIGRAEPAGETMDVDFLFPAPRNLGEQRRLASRVQVKFAPFERMSEAEELLEYKTELIYSQPYNNPFVRVRVTAPPGDVTVDVDSWISNLRPPVGKTQDQTLRFLRRKRAQKTLDKFVEKFNVRETPHWAKPEERQPRGPDIVKASGKTPFELVHSVVTQTSKLVPYQAGLHMTDPFQVMLTGGGDAESRASVVWYALQNQMRVTQVTGYFRPFVDTEYAGFDAWNAMGLDGYCIADVRDPVSYLGHDHAQFVGTSIGADHVLEDYPQISRHQSYSAGLYFFTGGEFTMRQFAAVTATSGLAVDAPGGRYTFPQTEELIGRGAAADELDAQLRNPPPGIIQLAKEVSKKRIEVNRRR
ncbi:MAG: hypothetical protein MPJ50_15820 [Pirellulales bacterium]|nr:hypothetical protein [Pirellulales bacterium]